MGIFVTQTSEQEQQTYRWGGGGGGTAGQDNLSRSGSKIRMNDFPVIRYLCYTHRILGSPGGKHCKSP